MSVHADLRERVAAANRAIHDAGLVTLSFGNVSGVDRDENLLVIKPSGVPYAELRAESMVVVDLDDGRVVDGTLRPSTDTPTHRLLYRDFPSIGGVIHTHSPSATAWAQAGRPIPCLGTTHADYFRGSVPVSRPLRPEEIAGDYEWETGRVIVETLADAGRSPIEAPAVLVGSHGPFAWGSSPEAAVETAIALEALADMAFRTLVLEASVAEIGEELLARHFDRKHGAGAYYGQDGS
jgi:L-ribulose-5-phosphate 4-epimerase